jgi:exodeoxyribonuclease V beta subunit
MKAFDLTGPLPTGTMVLEASAGTGKTFTIAALTTRYIAEGAAELSQVMLVTFGNAASRELRDRVRERLVSAELGLRDPVAARTSDDEVLTLLAAADDTEVELRRSRLAAALAGFDAATIATTHSFCSKMLTDLGLAADTDPAASFTDNVDDLVRDVVHDLYLQAYGRPGAAEPAMSYDEVLNLGRRAVGSDRSALLQPLSATGLPGQRRAAAAAVRDEVQARKRQLALVDYDDWLVLLRDALADPVHGVIACHRVRSRYRVVLVDEFQDTDPVQWQILQLAFHTHLTLVLIGDPKQAIYAFRGGDVTTYLAASAAATSTGTLTRNWRSDSHLLTALDQLFGGAALGDPRIIVRPVDSAHPHARLTNAGAPLRLRHLTRTGHGSLWKGLPKIDPVRNAVAADVATDIVALLTGPARLNGHAVQPADIAVLVRTNKQGALVRAALGTAGVPAVVAGGGSVFTTASASHWLRLLEAMEQPHRAGRVRSAALTVLLGHSSASLDQAGDELTDALAQRLRSWADLLADRGVAAFFEVLTAQEQLPARLLAQPDGERLLTDLRHLAQSLHAAVVQEALGLTALVEWLRRRIAQAAQETTDERSRRLESDAAAVQVMTVHVSKGLEFPIVYVPYGWDRWTPGAPDMLRLHDSDGNRVLDVGGSGGPNYVQARRQHESEESGEDLRLMYVALTRAKCHVVAHWAPSLNTAAAPLHRLLFGAAGAGVEPVATVVPPSDADASARLAGLAATSAGGISSELVTPGPIPRWQPSLAPAAALDVSSFTRTLDTAWTRTSYSGLTADAHHAAGHGPGAGVGSEPDEPVKDDEHDERNEAAAATPESPAYAVRSPMADLPAGPAFGTLVHEILEELDPDVLTDRCHDAVAQHGFNQINADDLAAGLEPVLHTPLGSLGVTLAQIAAADRLAELDFELPLAGGDTALSHATLADVAALLRQHDLGALASYPELIAQLKPAALKGFLTGSIDAVLRRPGPTYSIVDYKTNWLGTDDLTAWHYRVEAMTAEMLRTHYVLQALLYSVALHRYLRWRQPGYDPHQHLGPVLYLFVRGMCGPDSPAGAGVIEWQPPAALIVALSDLLAGHP